MNTQWFLSKSGNVTGPLSLTDAQKYVGDHENVYVWKSNFMQWQAATQVAEFAEFAKTNKVEIVVPKALTDKFAVKKKRVYSKVLSCKEKFSENEKSLDELSEKIMSYKTMTINLSPGVQGAVSSIEKRYHLLVNKMNKLTSVVENAEEELISISNTFENKETEAPVDTEKTASADTTLEILDVVAEPSLENTSASEDSIAQALKSAEDEFLAKFATTESDDTAAEEFLSAELNDVTSDVDTIDSVEENDTALSEELAKLNTEIDAEELEASTKKDEKEPVAEVKGIFSKAKEADKKDEKATGFQGVKSLKGANKLLKQVFTPSEDTAAIPLSQQLKQLPKTEPVAANEEAPVAELAMAEGEEQNKVKRRRRR